MIESDSPTETDVVIIGAGMAGLAAARELHRSGRSCLVLEGGDGPGGRVRSDLVDGFRLDRGFQILLTAYPELARVVDLDALDLCCYGPGAFISIDGSLHRVADPFRRPGAAIDTVRAPIGSFADKVRLLRLVVDVRRGPVPDLFRRPDVSTLDALRASGFSDQMIDRFWRPLAGGIELDPTLGVSRRRFDVVLRMLATGDAAVPAAGMQALSDAVAAPLPTGTIRYGAPVERLDGTAAVLADGTRVAGRAVVVATEGPVAARLTGLPDPGSLAAGCCWFAAGSSPVADPFLVLDGDNRGPVRNVAPLSVVAPSYAPAGRALVAAAIPGPDALGADLERAVRAQLTGWFGPAVADWELLRYDRIEHGQPRQVPPFAPKRSIRLGDGRYVCGDHRDTGSIQGALFSGRRAAEAVHHDLGA